VVTGAACEYNDPPSRSTVAQSDVESIVNRNFVRRRDATGRGGPVSAGGTVVVFGAVVVVVVFGFAVVVVVFGFAVVVVFGLVVVVVFREVALVIRAPPLATPGSAKAARMTKLRAMTVSDCLFN
jgi:hypothetical protein